MRAQHTKEALFSASLVKGTLLETGPANHPYKDARTGWSKSDPPSKPCPPPPPRRRGRHGCVWLREGLAARLVRSQDGRGCGSLASRGRSASRRDWEETEVVGSDAMGCRASACCHPNLNARGQEPAPQQATASHLLARSRHREI